MRKSLFKRFDAEETKPNYGERVIISPTGFGRKSLDRYLERICSSGLIENVIIDDIIASEFLEKRQLDELMSGPISHSTWYISFDDGSRCIFEFDDDSSLIFLHPSTISSAESELPVKDLYLAASNEYRVLVDNNYPEVVVSRFKSFLELALQ